MWVAALLFLATTPAVVPDCPPERPEPALSLASEVIQEAFRRSVADELIATHATPVKWNEARVFLYEYYGREDGNVFDFYGREWLRGPKLGMDEKLVNIEHTWPQSRFEHGWDGVRDFKFDEGLMKGDLHNLFPTSELLNSERANKPFAEVEGCDPAKSCATETAFEPPDVHKGDAARATLYFAIRYGQTIPPELEATMRAWNLQDPPDDGERTRNDAIAARQGNRNPFIDDPALAEKIADF